MAELIDKGMLKNCYAGDFRMDGKTPCTATYASIRKMIDMQPTTTEAEIRNRAIEEFKELAFTMFTDFGMVHGYPTLGDVETILYDAAEQLKERET